MKKVFFVILISAMNISIYAGQVSKHGQLSVKGVHLVDKNEQPVVLRGVSFGWANAHGHHGLFYNEQAVDWLVSDWKCTLLRAAVSVEPKNGYIANPELHTQLIVNVVDAAIKNDVYVIIDWHSHGIRTPEAVEFFSKMAAKYGKYPNVIYEIFNEPVRQSWEEVKEYSETVIRAIREIDEDNIILVGSPHWDQDVHIAADSPIKGYTNLMYTLHFYAATHKKELKKRGDYALRKGLPLFVSECGGMEASGDGPIDMDSWNGWLKWMEEHKLSWVCWSLSSKKESCSMIKDDSIDPKGGWTDDDLKEWGKVVREILREHAK
jgi:endoglucanase